MKLSSGVYEWTMYGVSVRVESSEVQVRLPGGVYDTQTRWHWRRAEAPYAANGNFRSRLKAKQDAKRWLKSKGFDRKDEGSPRSADNSGSPSETGAG